MIEDKLSLLESLNINLNNKDSINKIVKAISGIKERGFAEINIKIEGSFKKIVADSGYDLKLFNKIKALQELPEKVVYDLIDSCGKLKGTGLGKRVSR